MRRPRVSPWLIAVQLLLATVIATYAAHEHDSSRAEQEQARLTAQVTPALQALTAQTVSRLDDLSALADADGRVDGERFGRIARRLLRDPALGSVAITRRGGGREAIVQIRGRGLELRRGQDLAGVPQARRAMRDAVSSGRRRLSAPVPVDGAAGAVLVVPIFESGRSTSSSTARRRALLGYAVGAYRLDRLMAALRRSLPAGAAFAIADGRRALTPAAALDAPRRTTVDVEGRDWTLAVGRTDPGMGLAGLVGVIGGGLTLLLGLLGLTFSRREATAERAVAEHSTAARVGTAVASSIEEGVCLVRACDGTIVDTNATCDRLFGRAAGDLCGRHVAALLAPAQDAGAIAAHLERHGGWRGELEAARADGSRFPMRGNIAPMDHPEHGAVWIAVLSDVSAERETRAALDEAEGQFQLLAENATDWISRHALDGTWLYCSPACLQVVGYSPQELVGGDPFLFAHPEDLDALRRAQGSLLEGPDTAEVRFRFRNRSGDYVWLEISGRAVRDEHGTVTEIQASTRDVSARVAAEQELREAESRFRSAFEHAGTGMALIGVRGRDAGRFIQVNDALCSITGYTRGELVEMTMTELTHPEDHLASEDATSALVSGAVPSVNIEKRLVNRIGEPLWATVISSIARDGDDAPLYRVVHIQDVTERKRAEDQLQFLADHDPLTGLFNRRRFGEELERVVAASRRYGTPGALMAIDLDGFKQINDTLGHAAGDELLGRIAGLLRERLRDSDAVARVGGDEFAILLPQATEEQAERVAGALVEVVSRNGMAATDKGSRRTSASIGVAVFGGEAAAYRGGDPTAEELLVEADIAMYEAKEKGKDTFVVFDPGAGGNARMEAHVAWSDEIRHALAEDRFVLQVQPIAAVRARHEPEDGRTEALLRMVGTDGDLIPPATFLGVSERAGLVCEIDRWVVRHAIAMLGEHARAGARPVLHVNVSASSIADEGLTDLIGGELAAAGVEGRQLVLELQETAAIVNVDLARRFARRLRELGCGFALDDFGAGFGSFYYLKHLEFDYLKIDGEFIEDLAGSETNRLVVKSIVDLARGMGKRTIAARVPDGEALEWLHFLGVDLAQGHGVAATEPMPRPATEDVAP